MFKRLIPLAAISLLSGCSLVNGTQYHQQNLNAIHTSEKNVNNKMNELSLQLSQQDQQLASLNLNVEALKKQLDTYHSEAMNRPAPPVATIAKTTKEKPMSGEHTPSKKITLGELERVSFDSIDQSFIARIDTGAATSSLNAADIQEFERNSQHWVRFHLFDDENATEDKNWIEAPILRHVKIIQTNMEKPQRRPVVELWIKVGSIHEKVQFNLADRTQMKYPILLGREFLRDIAVVDISRQFIQTDNKQK